MKGGDLMCFKTIDCGPAYRDVGCQCGCHPGHPSSGQCGCGMQGNLSRKKKITALKEMKSHLEDKLDDINEYIKELESSK